MNTPKLITAVFTSLHLAAAAMPEIPAWHFVPPEGSGVVSVKDYGAKGDGVTDDTMAILTAISENIDKKRYRSNPFIYLPNGTYLVSDSIEGRVLGKGREEGKAFSAGWLSMLLLIGETREGTIIKLKDGAPGYQDAEKPKWVIATGSESEKKNNYQGGGNRAFRHNIMNLTVDVGNGNPGAIGIDFVANNRGSISGVTLRSGENSGHTAISLKRPWPGPAMIFDVAVHGFDHAIAMDHYQYGMTFENITIRNPRKTAFVNTNNVAVIRRLDYSGDKPFYLAGGGHSMLCLLDSILTYTGQEETAAIQSGGILNLRRVTATGFPTFVKNLNKNGKDLPAKKDGPSQLVSYDQGSTHDTSGKTAQPLNLPIEDFPVIRPPEGTPWTSGGTTGESLQAAIDGGAEYIFLPSQIAMAFSEPVVLRNKVKLIMGMHGHVVGPPHDPKKREKRAPAFIMGDSGAEIVCIEHVCIDGVTENPSSRTLVLRHVDLGSHGLLATGTGKSHIMDCIGRNYSIGPKHRFWARQLNAEFGPDPLFTNAGTSVILGFKMETSPAGSKDAPLSTPSLLNLSGDLEVFGGLLYTLGSKKEHAPKVPAFINESGRLSISYRNNGSPKTYYPVILRKGKFDGGEDVPASMIKGPGAALLFDERR